MNPIVSFVIPTRDRPELLAQTLASLRGQTVATWEAIVVDDGSAPGALQPTMGQAIDERVRVIVRDNPPQGANRCRNLGLAAARSDLVVFLDDDDLMSETCAEARASFMAARPHLDFAVFPHRHFKQEPGDCGTRVIARDGVDHIDSFLSVRIPWQTAGPVWRRAFLDRVGTWDESLPCWQDWELTVRALSMAPSYACAPAPFYWHRLTTPDRESISMRGLSEERLAGNERAIRLGCESLRARGMLTRRRRRLLARLFLFVAERWVQLGRPERARRTWLDGAEHGLVGAAASRLGLLLLGGSLGRLSRAAVRRAIWMSL